MIIFLKKIALLLLMFIVASCSSTSQKPNLLMNLKDLNFSKIDAKLAKASARGNIEDIISLIEQGGNVNSTGSNGMPILFWSLRQQNIRGFEAMLKHGSNPNYSWTTGLSIIELTSSLRDSKYLETVLNNNGNPNHINPTSKISPLIKAATNGLRLNISLLLNAGANIDYQDSAGESALFYAVSLGQYDAAVFLIEKGANLELRNVWGNNAGHTLNKRLDSPELGQTGYESFKYLKRIFAERVMRGYSRTT